MEGHQEWISARFDGGEFQLIITTDKNIPFQQNLLRRQISAIILPSNRLRILIKLMPDIESAIATIMPGQFVELTAE
jgi:hypothetical protein